MDANRLNQQLIILVNSMFQEGFLDEQFTQLQMLQDASNPGFVADVISLFSEDSERLLAELTTTLEQDPIDFRKVDAYVHQFKGSSSSIGAHRVKLVCIDFRAFCEGGNREGYKLNGMLTILLWGKPFGFFKYFFVLIYDLLYLGRCQQALQQVKQEFYLLKSKLETMLQLEQKIHAAGSAIPIK